MKVIFYTIVPTFAIVFLYAGISVLKTFKALTIDSGILLNCALINALAVVANA